MQHKQSQPMRKETLKQLNGASARERFLHRLHSVALVLNGMSASEAGRIYGDSPRAVAYWVKRFNRLGVDGLNEETRSGRPSTLNQSQLKKLQSFIKRTTSSAKQVNAKSVSAYLLKEYGITLTDRQCWRILKKLRT